jgi:hypothetical protein
MAEPRPRLILIASDLAGAHTGRKMAIKASTDLPPCPSCGNRLKHAHPSRHVFGEDTEVFVCTACDATITQEARETREARPHETLSREAGVLFLAQPFRAPTADSRARVTTEPSFGVEHRRALALLAEVPAGLTDRLLRAQGIKAAVLADLVDAGLVAATPQLFYSQAGPPIPILRVSITQAGRDAALDGGRTEAHRRS